MSNRVPLRRALQAAVVIVALAASPAAAQESNRNEGLFGAGSVLASLVYGPAKLAYAVGGSLVGGLAWMFSGGDHETMQPIMDAALRGDYVITPEHLRGERRVEFVGRPRGRALRTGDASTIESEEIYRDSF